MVLASGTNSLGKYNKHLDGSVWGWGVIYNAYMTGSTATFATIGAGDGGSTFRTSAVQVTFLSTTPAAGATVVDMSAGSIHAMLLYSDGTVFSFGANINKTVTFLYDLTL
jgi:hypothetical protein